MPATHDAGNSTHDAQHVLEDAARQVDAVFASLSDRLAGTPPRVVEAMLYSLTAGGKRLRPALVLESARACGGREADRSITAAAAAIELIHTFSLVHDDLPAMDDDHLRRGRPTNHKVFGEAMAILAGDAMVMLAFELLATDATPQVAPALARELARASGPAGMIGGQVLDMAAENTQLALGDLQRLHSLKTGALIMAACRMGAIAAGATAEQLSSLTTYGRHIGLAFQIVDDLLDVTSTPEQLGKATHKDQGKGKNTYPALLGVDASRARALAEVDHAVAALEPLGEASARLRALAQFTVQRVR